MQIIYPQYKHSDTPASRLVRSVNLWVLSELFFVLGAYTHFEQNETRNYTSKPELEFFLTNNKPFDEVWKTDDDV